MQQLFHCIILTKGDVENAESLKPLKSVLGGLRLSSIFNVASDNFISVLSKHLSRDVLSVMQNIKYNENEIVALEFKAEKSSSNISSKKRSRSRSSKQVALSLGQEEKSIRINKAILSAFPLKVACNCGINFNG
ncbi:hypothetical protein BD560DRAFT_420207 [Blakeslea trispora]|nr:hypothetical protein BD560DRAFT_420207 [Blakeslea trispora]